MRAIIAVALACCFASGAAAQSSSDSSDNKVANLKGPRIGATLVTGREAGMLKDELHAGPLLLQFGWQDEQRMYRTPSGTELLWESVLLIGGVEQNTFVPSLTMMVGIRGKDGLEFGFGPNLSLSGLAYAFSVGTSKRVGGLNVPIDFAVVPSPKGVRFSVLTGFNVRY